MIGGSWGERVTDAELKLMRIESKETRREISNGLVGVPVTIARSQKLFSKTCGVGSILWVLEETRGVAFFSRDSNGYAARGDWWIGGEWLGGFEAVWWVTSRRIEENGIENPCISGTARYSPSWPSMTDVAGLLTAGCSNRSGTRSSIASVEGPGTRWCSMGGGRVQSSCLKAATSKCLAALQERPSEISPPIADCRNACLG